jgi:hypothetical protein
LLRREASGFRVHSYRAALSVVNLRLDGTPSGKALEDGTLSKSLAAPGAGDGMCTSLESVEALLNLKMGGEINSDFKVSLLLTVL